ncbi:MAG: CpaD family pilus assembly lipoprotein [Alphaproteobacteria bacterium]
MPRIRHLPALLALLALAACDEPWHVSDAGYYNHGGPEQLLDVSSEVVNLSIAGPQQVGELSRWISKDHPTRAELYCTAGDRNCVAAHRVLASAQIPVMDVPSAEATVTLVYERVVARDCDQRYRDDTHDYLLYNHTEFGCAVAANIVQSVADKQEFVAPNLTDVPYATGAATAYDRAYTPPQAPQQGYSLQQSVLGQASSANGGQ